MRYFIKTLTDYALCIYLVLILGVMPFYNRAGYSHMGTDKAFFYNTITVYMGRIFLALVLVYLVISLKDLRKLTLRDLRRRLSVTDLFAGAYGLALILSYLLSRYRENALWGANGWYMGFWPQMFLVLTYFFVSRLWAPRKWVLYLALGVSTAVFLLGYLNRFSVDPLNMATSGPLFISTIGNINWYCGYLTSVFFAGAALLWQGMGEKIWKNILLSLYVTLGFGALITQGSASGLVALFAVLLALFCMSATDSGRMLMFWVEMTLLGISCLITGIVCRLAPDRLNYDFDGIGLLISGWFPILLTGVSALVLFWVSRCRKKQIYPQKAAVALSRAALLITVSGILLFAAMVLINSLRPGSLGPLSKYSVFTYSPDWGSNRGATWAAGWTIFAKQNLLHKLIGVGPDAMSAYLANDASRELNSFISENFPSQVLTNAHCEWLNVLINTGLLGLAAFAGMMLTGIRRFLREAGKNKIVCACGFCLLAYTANNLFSFQQTMNVTTLFAIFGMGSAFLLQRETQESPVSAHTSPNGLKAGNKKPAAGNPVIKKRKTSSNRKNNRKR